MPTLPRLNPFSGRLELVQEDQVGVLGPSSSTDNALTRWNGTGGTTIQNSDAILSDDGELTLTNDLLISQNAGGTLGNATSSWAELYLATEGVINWNNGNVELRHSANLLTLTGGLTTIGPLTVDGSADRTHLTVQGHSTQTSNLAIFEQSDGTDVVTIGGDGLITTIGGVVINGSTDRIQLTVQGHSTQTNDLAVFKQSSGTEVTSIDNNGLLTSQGGILIHDTDENVFEIQTDANGVMLQLTTNNPNNRTNSGEVMLINNASNGTFTGGADNSIGLLIKSNQTSGTQSAMHRGLQVNLSITGSAVHTGTVTEAAVGFQNITNVTTTGTVSEVVAFNSLVGIGSGSINVGAITEATGLKFGVSMNTSGTASVTDLYGIYVISTGGTSTAGGRTVTNGYGLFIDDQIQDGITNAWAIKTGTGEVDLGGGLTLNRTATATDYTLDQDDFFVVVTDTSVARTMTLPTAAVASGKTYIIKDESGAAGTNNITVATEGAETIDGAATVTISANYGVVRLYSDGTNWFSF